MNLKTSPKSWSLFQRRVFIFLLILQFPLSLMCIYCVCECKAGTVCLLALYGSWKTLYFGSKCKKKKTFSLQNVLLWSMISRTHPFLWIDMHFYLKDRMNINVTRTLKRVGRGDGNSRLFQGFRRHLVLSRVNLNTYFFYSLDLIDIFPLSTPNRIWPLGFKTYEKLDESTMYTNFRNTFSFSFCVWKYSD